MKNRKIICFLIIAVVFIISFSIPFFTNGNVGKYPLNKNVSSLDSFLAKNENIKKDNLTKLDDNHYLINDDNKHLVDLEEKQMINSYDVINDSQDFKELLFKELRLKYPLFIVSSIIDKDYKEFDVFNDKIYISFNDDVGCQYDATLICKDYKDLVDYKCVDDIDVDPNILPIDPNKKIIALTFDDGPSSYTEAVINELKNYNMKATFFELGSLMEKYPNIVKMVLDNGFEVGSHGYSHQSFVKLKLEGTIEELNRTNEIYKNITGEDIKLVRPPYGAINSTIREGIGLAFVRWSVDSLDWKVKDERYVENIMSVVKDGDIVLAHDIHKSTLDNLSSLLMRLYNEGFQVVTVSELASIKGMNIEPHQLYFHFRTT